LSCDCCSYPVCPFSYIYLCSYIQMLGGISLCVHLIALELCVHSNCACTRTRFCEWFTICIKWVVWYSELVPRTPCTRIRVRRCIKYIPYLNFLLSKFSWTLYWMNFNLAEISTELLLTYVAELSIEYNLAELSTEPSWTFYWMTFNLLDNSIAELSTEWLLSLYWMTFNQGELYTWSILTCTFYHDCSIRVTILL